MLNVKEIFFSIQGEGPYAGKPAMFIRLAGCPLKCRLGSGICDTDFVNGTKMSESFIMSSLLDRTVNKCDPIIPMLVVITGGEPLAQDISGLVSMLLQPFNGWNFYVQIETSGVTCHENNFKVLEDVTIVCSPKTPKIVERLKELIFCYKYVSKKGPVDEDGLPVELLSGSADLKIFRDSEMLKQCPGAIYLSPMDEGDKKKNQENLKYVAELCMQNGWSVSMQLHKIIGLR